MTRWDLFAVGKEKNPAGYRFLMKDEERWNCWMCAGDSDWRLDGRPARHRSAAGPNFFDSFCLLFVTKRVVSLRPDVNDAVCLRPDFLSGWLHHSAKLLFDLRHK